MTTDDKMNAMQAVTAVVAGIFIGVALTDSTTSEFWLYRYQTIIAGILAIVAAGWTVVEMRRTDQRQQLRHEELMKINLRADRLRARRAAFPYADLIESGCNELDAGLAAFVEAGGLNLGTIQALRNLIITRMKTAEWMASDPVVGAKDMFGSKMSFSAHTVQLVLDTSAVHQNTVLGFADNAWHEPNEYVKNAVDKYMKSTEEFSKQAKSFALHLRLLASHYD